MDSKVNYTFVGLFTILLGIALLVIAFWLSYGLDSKRYGTYIVYMKESVNGLSVNSAVKYNGVSVGFVRDIRLRRDDPQQVRLRLEIEDGIPITQSTVATLSSQGLTGISVVNLKGGSINSPLLVPKANERFPVIKSEPSLLVRLDATIQDVSLSLKKLSTNVNSFFESHNQQFSMIMENTTTASKQFPVLINSLNATSLQLKKVADQGLPQTIQTMKQVQDLSIELKGLTTDIRNNPSMLIRGRPLPPPGPGE